MGDLLCAEQVSSSRHVSAENRGFLDETVVYIQEHREYVVPYASGHIHSCPQVTYRLLSRELGIHVNVAKKCVFYFIFFLSFILILRGSDNYPLFGGTRR